MDTPLFEAFGVAVFRRGSRMVARYDAGGIVVNYREDEITEDEATRLRISESEAHQVLLAIERRQENQGSKRKVCFRPTADIDCEQVRSR